MKDKTLRHSPVAIRFKSKRHHDVQVGRRNTQLIDVKLISACIITSKPSSVFASLFVIVRQYEGV